MDPAELEQDMRFVVKQAKIFFRSHPAVGDYDDLVSVGYVALVECKRTYDPGKGATFHTYLYRRVYGAMYDYLRLIDPLPRDHRKKLGTGHKTTVQFADESYADELGPNINSLQAPDVDVYDIVLKRELREIIHKMPPKLRFVMQQHLLGVSFRRIARDLSVSMWHMPQLYAEGMRYLRKHMVSRHKLRQQQLQLRSKSTVCS